MYQACLSLVGVIKQRLLGSLSSPLVIHQTSVSIYVLSWQCAEFLLTSEPKGSRDILQPDGSEKLTQQK